MSKKKYIVDAKAKSIWPEIKPEVSLKDIDLEKREARTNRYRQEKMKEELEISSDDFWWLLECLPPCRWTKVQGVEIFHVSERLSLDLVQWVGQIDNKYYKLVDSENAELSYIAERFINLGDPVTHFV
jgi:hypothetical protein